MTTRVSLGLIAFGLLAFFLSPRVPYQAPHATASENSPTPELTGFPNLTGKLEQLLGHEGGYVAPKAGEPFQLDLAQLASVWKLDFDAERKSYIPLPGPLKVEAMHYYSNGAFKNMRLVSSTTSGRVVVDIVPTPGAAPNRVLVWVAVEREVLRGVALISCDADGQFPNKR